MSAILVIKRHGLEVQMELLSDDAAQSERRLGGSLRDRPTAISRQPTQVKAASREWYTSICCFENADRTQSAEIRRDSARKPSQKEIDDGR